MIEGWYSYRFTGNTISENAALNKLVGVGSINIKGGVVTGTHQASTLVLEDADAQLVSRTYQVEGTFTPSTQPHGLGVADLTFTSPEQKMKDRFSIVQVESDARFWFISTKPVLIGSNGEEDAQDIISGEAVRAS